MKVTKTGWESDITEGAVEKRKLFFCQNLHPRSLSCIPQPGLGDSKYPTYEEGPGCFCNSALFFTLSVCKSITNF